MKPAILAAAFLAACTPLAGSPDDVSRDDRATYAPPPRQVSEVLGAFGGGRTEPAFPGATRPVIVRRLFEDATIRVWTADPVTGACCNSMTIEQYGQRYRGQ